MLIAHIRHADGRFETVSSMLDAARALREPGSQIWLDLEAPDECTLMLLGEAFSFHPLAIEDCVHAEQRPRLDPYDGHIFLVAYAPVLDAENRFDGVRELAIFCSAQYMVTIHHQPLRGLAALRDRCPRDPENILGRGMDRLLHMIVDGVVDAYQPLLEELEAQAIELEDTALTDPSASVLGRISELKSQLLQVRRYLLPLRESFSQLARGEYAFIGKNLQPYFRDVLDHLLRTLEMIELFREQTVAAREVYMSALSQRTNEIMKTLSIFATIMMPLTLVAGIYGMNFESLWPPTNHPYGFWMVVGGMTTLGSGLFYWFKRSHFL
jgi:magnesium transporter